MTSCWSGVMAMTLTQLAESMMKKSCSFFVSGEIFVSARMVKIRKSPSGREPIFFQGCIICDLRFTREAVCCALSEARVNRKSEIANSQSFFFCRPALAHQLYEVPQRVL